MQEEQRRNPEQQDHGMQNKSDTKAGETGMLSPSNAIGLSHPTPPPRTEGSNGRDTPAGNDSTQPYWTLHHIKRYPSITSTQTPSNESKGHTYLPSHQSTPSDYYVTDQTSLTQPITTAHQIVANKKAGSDSRRNQVKLARVSRDTPSAKGISEEG
ncbi:hypothetical protein Pmani_040118 [Petrolisthes manimaculis]|uniref:Uncharacterized protein n=1 Tax=Petrolisthes manimaculis TaxID=1843537 RepID=A0AAE1NCX2_9EUCA|nr:hypothetical protein Pmani_040118 [Petrolisthes manimaculis]